MVVTVVGCSGGACGGGFAEHGGGVPADLPGEYGTARPAAAGGEHQDRRYRQHRD